MKENYVRRYVVVTLRKKLVVFSISVLALFVFVGCSGNAVGDSITCSADLSDYRAFTTVSSQDNSRAMAPDSVNILLGLDKIDGDFKEIKFTTEAGFEAPVQNIHKIGNEYLFLDFGFRTYIVNVEQNKYLELRNLNGCYGNSMYKTDKGLYALLGTNGNPEVVCIDFDSQKITPLTNKNIDTGIKDLYASKSGHFITSQSMEYCNVFKYFPENGNPPLKTEVDISSDSMNYIGSPDVDYLFSPITGIKYVFSNDGIKEEVVQDCLVKKNDFRKVFITQNIHDLSTGIMGIINGGIFYVSQIINGELVCEEFTIPFDSEIIYKCLIKEDYLIYDVKDSSEIRYWNFKTGEVGLIFSGTYGSWNASGNGIFYTKYRTATAFETIYYDVDTKTSEVIADDSVEVVDAVWYEY